MSTRGPDSGFKPHDVELVRRNESQVVVKGLDEGTTVALANPDQATRNKQAGERPAGASRQMMGDLLLAVDNLRAQKTRTLLTALGIVFGVGSVIGMLAIGAGAREESLRFIEQLGVRNVLIDSRPATRPKRNCSSGGDPRRALPNGTSGSSAAISTVSTRSRCGGRCVRRGCCRSRRAICRD